MKKISGVLMVLFFLTSPRLATANENRGLLDINQGVLRETNETQLGEGRNIGFERVPHLFLERMTEGQDRLESAKEEIIHQARGQSFSSPYARLVGQETGEVLSHLFTEDSMVGRVATEEGSRDELYLSDYLMWMIAFPLALLTIALGIQLGKKYGKWMRKQRYDEQEHSL